MRRMISTMVAPLALYGCVMTPTYLPSASGKEVSEINIAVDGLDKHVLFRNDTAWINIYEEEISPYHDPISMYELDTENMEVSFPINSNQKYEYQIHSLEHHFGGHSSCAVRFHITPIADVRYFIDFFTKKSSCSAEIKAYEASGDLLGSGTVDGFMNGVVNYRVVIQ
ncbi:MAG: hypothetical protein R3208_21555 [Ketobacteraceae bacterium]|nr:hypothetical protein [Ketobacteraceae bacterium]